MPIDRSTAAQPARSRTLAVSTPSSMPAAALAPLLERVADEDRVALAALLLDRVDDREREAHPVLEAAAEPVGAHVEERAHELGEQVAVGGVELDGVEAGLLDPPGGLAEEVDQLEDLGDRGGPDLLALLLGVLVDDLVAGRPGQLEDAVRGAQRVVARDGALAAGMLELDRALRAVAVHPLGQAGEARDVVVAVGHEAGHGGAAGLHVRRGRADDDEAGPAAGDVGVVMDVALAHLAVGMRRADVRRHVDDPVRQLDVPQLDRAEQVRERHDRISWAGGRSRRLMLPGLAPVRGRPGDTGASARRRARAAGAGATSGRSRSLSIFPGPFVVRMRAARIARRPSLERSSTMAKYLLAFRGGQHARGRGGRGQGDAAWEAWFSSLGAAVADPGNPSTYSRTTSVDGTVGPQGPASLSGYTILSADSLDAAVALAKGCPVLAGGSSIEVIETVDVM